MRTLTTPASDQLQQNCGTEGIVIVEIQWVPGGGHCAYADRKIADTVLGQIVEIGSIDSTVKADGSTDSSQVHLTLEDTDGRIKALCDQHDLHKRPVWIYQWFQGLDLADKFLLFKGEINSPFVWNEGDRTVSFDVTTKIEDVEAGFSMEEGDFPVIPPAMLGKAWPLAFGHVCDVKAVQVRAPRRGILQSGEGIRDYTLESRICQAGYIQCADAPTGTKTIVTPESTVTSDGTVWKFNVTEVMGSGPDQSCVDDRFFEICSLLDQVSQQKAYEHATMTVIGGSDLFPQGEKITLNIGGGKFTGTFSGDVFTIESRVHPDYEVNPPTVCRHVGDRTYQVKRVIGGGVWLQTAGGTAWYDPSDPNAPGFCPTPQTGLEQVSVDGPRDSRKAYDDMVTSSFFWARAGSEVYLEAEAEVLYIINLLPCTVLRVAAMKQTNLGPKLMTVPADYYTLYETDYDGYTVTEIGMTKPLSQRSKIVAEPGTATEYNPGGTHRLVSEQWTDDLYVTVASSVGPNPVDIIAWLIGKYTSLSVDSASFDHVRTCLTKYPVGFALEERKNVMDLIADIAVQSRCVVYVRNDVVYLKYFSEEPTSAGTITASDVLANSLQVTLSSTDEVVTKHIITWSRSQSEGELKIILKHNVAKYGTHEKDHAYATHNIYDNLLKSATFWAIRDANVWKLVQFSTPLKWLALEVFDCVTLDLPEVAPSPVKAVITAAKYDVAQEQIDWTCWTPLRAGEVTPYIHAWPANIPAGTIFPTAEERAAGLGYDFVVAPPAGHLLYVVTEDNGQPPARLTSGDPHPSDYDDVLEACFCPATDDAYVDEPDPVFVALKKAELANQDNQQAKTDRGAGGGKNDQDKKKERGCGGTEMGGGCLYEVRVGYITPVMVCGNCDCWAHANADVGLVATSTSHEFCHTFGAMFSASLFVSQMKLEIAKHLHKCPGGSTVIWGSPGQTFPSTVSGPVALPDPDPLAEPCEQAPGDQTKPHQGETYKPSLKKT